MRVQSKYESRKTSYEIQTCCFVGRAFLRGRGNGAEDGGGDQTQYRNRRPTVLHAWPVVLERWSEVVLDPRTLGLALPSSRLDPRPLRAAVKTESISFEKYLSAARIPCGAFVFHCRCVATAVAVGHQELPLLMNKLLLLIFSLVVLAAAGCSRSNKPDTSVKPQSTPDVERLKSDSERLQQATANAAKEREKANQATPSPTATP